jgi:translation initiation factor IF-2
LLDMINLLAELEDLRAESVGPAQGLIIEAHMEQGRGPVAVALVQEGLLNVGQFVVAGGTYGRVRNLNSTGDLSIKQAGPSTPVVITGLKNLPDFGDTFFVVSTEKDARQQAEAIAYARKQTGGHTEMSGHELIRIINRSNKLEELNIIVKADVQGSLTSVVDSLKTLGTEEVAVRVVGSGVGPVNDNDVHMAKSSNAIIYGFHVDFAPSVRQIAARDKVSVRLYRVIYELIDDAKLELSSLLAPELIETEHGELVVRAVFKTTKSQVICGGEVLKGVLHPDTIARIYRDKELLAEARCTNLKRGPQEAKEIPQGEMCGMSLETDSKIDIQEGDRVFLFDRKHVERSL